MACPDEFHTEPYIYVIWDPYRTHIKPIWDAYRPHVKLIWGAHMGPTWIPYTYVPHMGNPYESHISVLYVLLAREHLFSSKISLLIKR